MIRIIVIAMLCLFGVDAYADDIIGRASIIDGDTIDIHGQRIRLWGIDAPESRQTCMKKEKPYRCGQAAANALDELIIGKVVTCRKRGKDRYRRIVSECFRGDLNINQWLVENGWALAYRKYSKKFIPAEQVAARTKQGIWQGNFVAPWDLRKAKAAPKQQFR